MCVFMGGDPGLGVGLNKVLLHMWTGRMCVFMGGDPGLGVGLNKVLLHMALSV